MKHLAKGVAVDDVSNALRLELGLAAKWDSRDQVHAVALPTSLVSGAAILEMAEIARDIRRGLIVLVLDEPALFDRPQMLIVVDPMEKAAIHMGFTLWAPADGGPLLAVARASGRAFAVGEDGLVNLDGVPGAIEGSLDHGIRRAVDRLRDSVLSTAEIGDVVPLTDEELERRMAAKGRRSQGRAPARALTDGSQ